MRTVLVTELEIDPNRLQPVLYYDGSPLTADTVYSKIIEALGMASEAVTGLKVAGKSDTGSGE